MKITITLNGVKIERELPTSWADVDFETFVKLADVQEPVKILSILVGVEYETLLKATIFNIEPILEAIKFVFSPIDEMPIPAKVLGYDIPKDLSFKSLAQFVDLKAIIGEEKPMRDKFPVILATYAVTPYDFQEAEKLAPAFLKAPCLEVMAVGNFTLLKLIELKRPIVKTSPRPSPLLNRLMQALANFRRNLGSLVRYYIWNGKQAINGKNYLNGV